MASPSNVPSNVSPGQLATADQYNAITSFMANYGIAIYATDPASPNPGQVWYNSTEGFLKIFAKSLFLNKTFTGATGHNKVRALTYLSPYVYVGYYTSPGIVDQITPSTMTVNKTFTAPTGHNDVDALTYLSPYVYAGYGTSPGIVDQITPSTMTVNKTFTGATGHNSVEGLVSDGTYVYAGYFTSPGIVDQIAFENAVKNITLS